MPPYDIGQLAQKVLDAFNKLSALRAAGASGYSIRLAESALKAAQVAEQAATGSQFGMGAGSGMGVTGLTGGLNAVGFDWSMYEQAFGLPHTPTLAENAISQLAQGLPEVPSTIGSMFKTLGQGVRSGLDTILNIGNPPPPQPTNYPSTFSVPTTGQPAWGTTGSPSRSPDALMEQNARRMTALRKVFRPRGTRQRLN